jgi:predicted nucleic acid-binding protein
MIILQEVGTAQSFSFIPRSDTYNTLQITDEQTGVTSNVTITTNVVGQYYNTITATFSLKENHYYTLTLKQNTNVVFKDKVFCTNQSIPTFSVNNGQYIVNTSNNDFILYE